MTRQQLPLPPFYDTANARKWGYQPDHAALLSAAVDWRGQYGIRPGSADAFQIFLLAIDAQRDFCFPKGTLFVGGRSGTGAMDDNARLAEFIYRNLGVISDIRVTLDTHFAYQIFFREFWLTRDGAHPEPHTTIRAADVRSGLYRPNPAIAAWLCNGNVGWMRKQAQFYCDELEKADKYSLYLWPPHCILGSDGHVLAGTIHEARMFHAFVRSLPGLAEVKGGNPWTENYSVPQPEVLMTHDGHPLAQKNTALLKTLINSGAVLVAGQAASHCVKSTIEDLLADFAAVDPDLLKKVYFMTDCTSAVTVPDDEGGFAVDYTDEAEAAQQKFAEAGMHLVKSTDPLESWPGIQL